MVEIYREEVRSFDKEYLCDSCDRGVMRFTGETFTLSALVNTAPVYLHLCDRCGEVKALPFEYPRLQITERRRIKETILERVKRWQKIAKRWFN